MGMKKAVVLATFLLLIAVQNVDSASSSVNIKNSVNTSNSTSSTSNCKTEVRIESNGEVKEYKSENCESVNMESSDGNSKVIINNNSNSNTQTTTPKPTKQPSPTISGEIQEEIDVATREAQAKIEKTEEEQMDFFQRLEQLIRNFIKSIFS